METLNLQQGSDEWLAVRAKHFTASEAPAMLGLSKYTSRQDLLRQKATGYVPEVDSAKQHLFDRGHEAEAAARPVVEEIIGDELYPSTGVREVDGLPLLASFDGITMSEDIVWENKLWNSGLAADIEAGVIGDHYWPQIEQQLLVSGADKAYFTASDGTPENTVGMWYQSVPKRRNQLIAGWKQFAEDIANYQHVEVAQPATAAPIKDLPALSVQIVGHVAASNLAEWKSVVTDRIQSINTNLQSDQDFADAGKMVTFLDDGEKKIDLVKAQAQSQAVEIDEIFRALDDIKATMRAKRLELNKLVEKRKIDIRAEIMQEGKQELAEHMAALNKRLGRVLMQPVNVDFAEAMKGKKTVSSLRGAVADTLANAKISANETADRIQANLATIDEHKEYAFLFNDQVALVMKAPDDLANVIKLRITEHAAEQQRKLEAEREKIRAEEQAKAQREAAGKAEAERKEQERIAAEAKAKADLEAAEKASAEKKLADAQAAKVAQPVETIALGAAFAPITQAVEPVQTQESDRQVWASTPKSFIKAENQDNGSKLQQLVAFINHTRFTDSEIDLMQHYAERLVEKRQEAA